MLSHLAILLVALVGLGKGADLLVEYAARIARRFQVSDLVVGLLITAVGTSLPELAACLAAALVGSSGLVIGNIVGSNIANIGLVLGVAALVRPLSTGPKMHDRDGFIMLATTLLVFGFALDNQIGRIEAAGFVVVFAAYTAFVVHSDRAGVEHHFKDFLKYFFDFEYATPVGGFAHRHGRSRGDGSERDLSGVAREAAVVAGGVAAVILGAHFVVRESVWLARLLELPENLIGVSLIAVGTSLPELLVALAAARRGNAEMIVGNVMGSNIANLMLIMGLSGLVRPLEVSELSVVYTMPIMLFFSIGLLHFIRTDWSIGRGQGALAVTAYIGFMVAAFLQGWA